VAVGAESFHDAKRGGTLRGVRSHLLLLLRFSDDL
jgi:hypothetical protein